MQPVKTARILLLLLLAVLLPARGVMAATLGCASADVAQANGAHAGHAEHLRPVHQVLPWHGPLESHVADHADAAHHAQRMHQAHHMPHHMPHHGAQASPTDATSGADAETRSAPSHDTAGCNLCAACCSASGVPSVGPALPPAALTGAVSFAELGAPAPIFESGGLERPPRSN